MMGMTQEKSPEKEVEGSSDGRTTFNNIKGTKVFDGDGEELGSVSDIEINLTTLNPTRLIIHKGFFGKYLRINLKYVEKITRDFIKLWITPAKNLVGTRVLDIDTTEIGRVEEAHKGKDGDLEYIKVVTSLIRAHDDEKGEDTYAIPMTSIDDATISLPPTSFEEEPVPSYIDLDKETVLIDADEIIDVGKECIRLREKKEKYLKKSKR